MLKTEINPQKVKEIVSNNLSLDNYWTLLLMQEKNDVIFCNIVDLKVAGWCDNHGNLTSKAKELIARLEKFEPVNTDYDSLYFAIQNTMIRHHRDKKKQIKGFGGIYFVPTVKELQEYLVRFWKQYPEMTDFVKITKILCDFTKECCKKDKFAPSIKYYIFKVGTGSQLASAYDNYEEEQIPVKRTNSEISL